MTTPTSDLQISVAAEVRAWLGRRQMSASRAADQLGWTQMYLSRRLNSRAPFDLNDLEALARVLGVPVTSFFEGPALSQRTNGMIVGAGSNKQNYWTPQRWDLHCYPRSGVAMPLHPDPAELRSAA